MAVSNELYDILGVTPNASQDDIKAAYRKAAMKWHPDRWVNGTDEEKATAESKFKDISKAYETLGDPEKRKRYDMYGPENEGQGGMNDAEMEEMMRNAFGGMFGGMFDGMFHGGQGRPSTRGKNVNATVQVTMEDMMNGADKTISFTRMKACHRCSGSGSEDNQTHQCHRCAGRGYVEMRTRTAMGIQIMTSVCPDCDGSGEVIDHPCPDCNGSGLEPETVEYGIHIPAGIVPGMTSAIRGAGSVGPHRGPSGDLLVNITAAPDSRGFDRVGNDLVYTFKAPFKTLVFGGDVSVPYIGGTQNIHIDKATPSGKVMRIYGKGFPSVDGGRRGDFLITVECEIPDPKNLSKEMKDAIKSMK